jgi:hypothetical protein
MGLALPIANPVLICANEPIRKPGKSNEPGLFRVIKHAKGKQSSNRIGEYLTGRNQN